CLSAAVRAASRAIPGNSGRAASGHGSGCRRPRRRETRSRGTRPTWARRERSRRRAALPPTWRASARSAVLWETDHSRECRRRAGAPAADLVEPVEHHAQLLAAAASQLAHQEEPTAVGGHVVRGSIAGDPHLVFPAEQRPRWSRAELGAELHRHSVQRVAVTEEEFAAATPPPRLATASHGNTPAGAPFQQPSHVHLV